MQFKISICTKLSTLELIEYIYSFEGFQHLFKLL